MQRWQNMLRVYDRFWLWMGQDSVIWQVTAVDSVATVFWTFRPFTHFLLRSGCLMLLTSFFNLFIYFFLSYSFIVWFECTLSYLIILSTIVLLQELKVFHNKGIIVCFHLGVCQTFSEVLHLRFPVFSDFFSSSYIDWFFLFKSLK